MCTCWRTQSHPPLDDLAPHMEFKHVSEPYLSEIRNYTRQRREQLMLFSTHTDVRAELFRNIMDGVQPIDLYPRGRQMVADENYLSILKDMFNLSIVLDDMEQTGAVPLPQRGHYYNVYSRLYRLLAHKAKHAPAAATAAAAAAATPAS